MAITGLTWALALAGAATGVAPAPIIDMHLHANPAPPEPATVCAPYDTLPERDPRDADVAYNAKTFGRPGCRHPIRSETTAAALRAASLAMLRRFNMTAVTSGPAALVEDWRRADSVRIVPAIELGAADQPSIAELRKLHAAGRLKVLGEIGAQYDGAAPADPRLEPYWALAEELDIPVAIHMGPGPPGTAYTGTPAYRAALSDPLLLEPVLAKHPRLRVYVMHAGWPLDGRMIALMYAWPQVYVDTAVIDWSQPRAEFWGYLKRLIDAGYGKRIMFGSDQMIWPGTIPTAIAGIIDAPFLAAAQKRDILHDNAARFLRLGSK